MRSLHESTCDDFTLNLGEIIIIDGNYLGNYNEEEES